VKVPLTGEAGANFKQVGLTTQALKIYLTVKPTVVLLGIEVLLALYVFTYRRVRRRDNCVRTVLELNF
jgi:hypothetical protein